MNYKEPSDTVRPEEADDDADEDEPMLAVAGGPEDAPLALTVAAYRARLVRGGKDLYKDPPALPPRGAVELAAHAPPPTRDAKTRRWRFADHPTFQPNLSPEEVLRRGSFGGTYFRAIDSAVTGERHTAKEALAGSVDPAWISGLDAPRLLTSPTYRAEVNRWGAKCGGSLGMWESSGWISALDPYGAFQWYVTSPHRAFERAAHFVSLFLALHSTSTAPPALLRCEMGRRPRTTGACER